MVKLLSKLVATTIGGVISTHHVKSTNVNYIAVKLNNESSFTSSGLSVNSLQRTLKKATDGGLLNSR